MTRTRILAQADKARAQGRIAHYFTLLLLANELGSVKYGEAVRRG